MSVTARKLLFCADCENGVQRRHCCECNGSYCADCTQRCQCCQSELCDQCRRECFNNTKLSAEGALLRCPACSSVDRYGRSVHYRWNPTRSPEDEEYYALNDIAKEALAHQDTRSLALVRERGAEFFQRHGEYTLGCFSGNALFKCVYSQ